MDRRRFNPSPEGLEGRALLSLFGGLKTANQNATISVQDLPKTYKEKELRIAHLPYYLLQENPRRFLSPTVTNQLQTDINTVVSELHAPTSQVVDNFNAGLRHLLPYNTLSPSNAKLVNHSFESVLERAGATPTEVANLTSDMNELALIDSKSIQPSTLARGDYSLVLQTTLAVGRPMITPAAPTLQAKDGRKIDGGRVGLTRDHNPTMVGSYPAGATNNGAIWIQIVNVENGQVVGTAPVSSTGTYSIKLITLPDGVYPLAARSSDEVGHLSDLSHPFTLHIKTYVPPKERLLKQPSPSTSSSQTSTTLSPPGGPLALLP